MAEVGFVIHTLHPEVGLHYINEGGEVLMRVDGAYVVDGHEVEGGGTLNEVEDRALGAFLLTDLIILIQSTNEGRGFMSGSEYEPHVGTMEEIEGTINEDNRAFEF